MPRKTLHTHKVEYLQILDEKGKLDAKLEPDLSGEDLIKLYRAMSFSRVADGRMLNLQRQGRIGTFGPGTGQEAAHCAPAFAMGEDDWFAGGFREPGARLMRGEPLHKMLLLYNGYEEGCVPPEGVTTLLPFSIVIPMQAMHAVGIAHALQYKGIKDTAVLTFFGDGGTSEGDFHEALNYAAVWQAPVVFVCQNNQYAISVPRHKQTHSRTLAQKAIAYDMPGIQVDGNDPLAMYAAAKEAFDRAKSGGGPTFIEAVTYRMMMHTTADDPTKYREQSEVDEWAKRCPLLRFKIYLESKGIWDDAKEEAMGEEIKAEIDAEIKVFEGLDGFKPDACFDHVFGTEHKVIEDQRAHFLAELEKERSDG